MRLCRIVSAVCLLASVMPMPAGAGTVGDGCQASVMAAFGVYFAAEEKLTAAASIAGAESCRLLDEQTASLDRLVKSIGTCPVEDENREFLPDIEALFRASVAQSAAWGCPRADGAK